MTLLLYGDTFTDCYGAADKSCEMLDRLRSRGKMCLKRTVLSLYQCGQLRCGSPKCSASWCHGGLSCSTTIHTTPSQSFPDGEQHPLLKKMILVARFLSEKCWKTKEFTEIIMSVWVEGSNSMLPHVHQVVDQHCDEWSRIRFVPLPMN